MNITFLDSFTLNPGDLSWEPLQALGTFREFDRTRPEDVLERAAGAEILIVNKVPLGEREFSALKNLRLVCVAATGYDVVDTQAARRHGIAVTNCANYSTGAVAQMVMAHILEVTNRVGYYAARNRDGFWTEAEDFCCWTSPLTELAGKRLAIVGYGNIGQAVGRLAAAFGMEVSAVTSKAAGQLPPEVQKVELAEAFRTSDFVSLNCPLTKENAGFVNAALLAEARPGLVVVNTARGGLVDEEAVASALRSGRLAAYCADVLSKEPPRKDNPLMGLHKAYITPHIAWATREARARIIRILVENIRSFAAGRPQNLVN